MYSRTCAIHRVQTVAGVAGTTIGLTPYSGMEQSPAPADPQGETVLFTGVICSIQAADTGRKKATALPSDVLFAPTWRIYIPNYALPQYSVRDRDVVIDDESYRYQVGQAYYSAAGYQLVCIRLEV